MAAVLEISDVTGFRAFIKDAGSKLTVVHFSAKWAPQCEQMNDVMSELAKETGGNVNYVKLEAEDLPEISEEFSISAVPTFIFVKNGKSVDRLDGAKAADLTKKVKLLASLTEVTTPAPPQPQKQDLNERLKQLIHAEDVMLFMKGTPAEPRCGFSKQMIAILKENNVKFGSFNILSDEEVRQGLKTYSNWPTYPQLYAKGELLGGLDIVKELVETGELKSQLPTQQSLDDRLKGLINKAPVMLFMKGERTAPRCGFSKQTIAILNDTQVEYETFDILTDEEVRQGLKTFSNWPTYPQLYVKGELVGGLDIIKVRVHISNLTTPRSCNQVRPLDPSHVESLKQIFKDSFRPGFVKLIGHVTGQPTAEEEYAIPGQVSVEVLGGNHTREALNNYNGFVYMDLYSNLSSMQALTLGLEHNQVHENAKLMSFEEMVLFMRKVLDNTKESSSKLPAKTLATKWRSNLCAIMSKTKTDLKNNYKVHLHLAALGPEEWNALLEVFHAFKQGTITKGGGCNQPSQYIFLPLLSAPADNKVGLLAALASGKLSIHQFRNECKSCSEKKKETSAYQVDRQETMLRLDNNAEDGVNNGPAQYSPARVETHKEEEQQAEIIDLRQSLKREKELRKVAEATITRKEQEIQRNDAEIRKLKEKVHRMEDDALNQDVRRKQTEMKLSTCEQRINIIMDENKSLQKALKGETMRCEAAEQAAARARSLLLCKDEKQQNQGQQKRKTMDDDYMDQCSTKKTASVTTSATTDDMKLADKTHNTKLQEDNIQMAIVEYNGRRLYYVKLYKEENKMVYCMKPFGIIVDKTFCHDPKKQSFLLNPKDIQYYDDSYVICRFEGKCSGSNILVDSMSLSMNDQLTLINKYINM